MFSIISLAKNSTPKELSVSLDKLQVDRLSAQEIMALALNEAGQKFLSILSSNQISTIAVELWNTPVAVQVKLESSGKTVALEATLLFLIASQKETREMLLGFSPKYWEKIPLAALITTYKIVGGYCTLWFVFNLVNTYNEFIQFSPTFFTRLPINVWLLTPDTEPRENLLQKLTEEDRGCLMLSRCRADWRETLPAQAWISLYENKESVLTHFLSLNLYAWVEPLFFTTLREQLLTVDLYSTHDPCLLTFLCRSQTFLEKIVSHNIGFFFSTPLIPYWLNTIQKNGSQHCAMTSLCQSQSGERILEQLQKDHVSILTMMLNELETKNEANLAWQLLCQLACCFSGLKYLEAEQKSLLSYTHKNFTHEPKVNNDYFCLLDMQALLQADTSNNPEALARAIYHQALMALDATQGVMNSDFAIKRLEYAWQTFYYVPAITKLAELKKLGYSISIALTGQPRLSMVGEFPVDKVPATSYVFFYWSGETLPTQQKIALRHWCQVLANTAFMPILIASPAVYQAILESGPNMRKVTYRKLHPQKQRTFASIDTDFYFNNIESVPLYAQYSDLNNTAFVVVNRDTYWDSLINATKDKKQEYLALIKQVYLLADTYGFVLFVKNRVMEMLIEYYGGWYFDLDLRPCQKTFPYHSMDDFLSLIHSNGEQHLIKSLDKCCVYKQMILRNQLSSPKKVAENTWHVANDIGWLLVPYRAEKPIEAYLYRHDLLLETIQNFIESNQAQQEKTKYDNKTKLYMQQTFSVKSSLMSSKNPAYYKALVTSYGLNPLQYQQLSKLWCLEHVFNKNLYNPAYLQDGYPQQLIIKYLERLFNLFSFNVKLSPKINQQHSRALHQRYFGRLVEPLCFYEVSSVLQTGIQQLQEFAWAATTIQRYFRARPKRSVVHEQKTKSWLQADLSWSVSRPQQQHSLCEKQGMPKHFNQQGDDDHLIYSTSTFYTTHSNYGDKTPSFAASKVLVEPEAIIFSLANSKDRPVDTQQIKALQHHSKTAVIMAVERFINYVNSQQQSVENFRFSIKNRDFIDDLIKYFSYLIIRTAWPPNLYLLAGKIYSSAGKQQLLGFNIGTNMLVAYNPTTKQLRMLSAASIASSEPELCKLENMAWQKCIFNHQLANDEIVFALTQSVWENFTTVNQDNGQIALDCEKFALINSFAKFSPSNSVGCYVEEWIKLVFEKHRLSAATSGGDVTIIALR